MKTIVFPVRKDVGFVRRTNGDLIPSRPKGDPIDPNCGWRRVNGDLIPTATAPTTGHWVPDGDDMKPRRI